MSGDWSDWIFGGLMLVVIWLGLRSLLHGKGGGSGGGGSGCGGCGGCGGD